MTLVSKYIDWQTGECSQSEFLIACYKEGLTDTEIAEVQLEGDMTMDIMGV